MEEEEAITRLQEGDVSGLDALMQLYQRPALRVAYLICRNATLAEDTVQSAFVRLYERIGQFDSARPFRPWFLRTVTNDMLMAMRHKHISLEGEAAEEADLIVGTEHNTLFNNVEVAETKAAIWAMLDKLSPAQRAAIVMRYYMDLSDKEIAETLQVPPGTVRRRLHDAHDNLRRLLPSHVKLEELD